MRTIQTNASDREVLTLSESDVPNPHPTLEEWDNAILSFGEIQAEINYKQAQDSLKRLVQNLSLCDREKAGLEAEIDHLSTTIQKLEQMVVQIAAFGMVGRGKSSVLNALLGQEAFVVGPLHGVTRTIDSAAWQVSQETLTNRAVDIQRVALPGVGNSQIQLIDTPGIDEVDGETREQLAKQVAKQADLILFIVAGDLTKVEFTALSQLRDVGKPILLVFNKIDQYPEADRQVIYQTIRDRRVRELLSPDEIVMVAASPLVKQATRDSAGKIHLKTERGQPQITELKLKILEILDREGKSLVALNTMLYADEVN
ncbi:MAG: Era-like GTP-binding protein, partial [Jaaginema sp. PMC 1079.18]|nr:Era-like GTP-binding protein [Jaaginema sp. PMC 1079.18]